LVFIPEWLKTKMKLSIKSASLFSKQ